MNWLNMSSLKEYTFLICCFLGSIAFGQSLKAQEKLMDDAKSSSYTIISGSIHQPSVDEVGLQFYRDFISFDEELFHVPIGGDNRFSMSFELTEPTTARFSYNGKSVELYLEPGDALSIDFDGITFPQSLRYEGKGKEHNTCLKGFSQQFSQWDEASLLYEMVQREPLNFRRMMDGLWAQKWSFYRNYQLADKSKFSKAFVHYLAAEIDYWWAYYLIRYRIEKPIATASTVPMELPTTYYSFLNSIIVSNDFALNNRQYLYFLDQYLSFRNDHVGTAIDSSFQTTGIWVKAPSMFVLSEPETEPILTELKQGTRLKYLGEKSDFKSKVLIKEALHEDFWFKIRTPDGIVGWVIGVGLTFEKEGEIGEVKLSNQTIKKENQHKNARKYLQGKPLYYTIANDIYWRSHIEKTEILKEEVADFLLNNSIASYDQIIETAFKAEVKQRTPVTEEIIYGATTYRIIKSPQIRSSRPVEDSNLNKTAIKKETAVASTTKDKETLGTENPSDVPLIAATVIDTLKTRPKIDSTTVITDPPSRVEPTSFVDIPPPPLKREGTHTMVQGKLKSAPTRMLKLILYSDPIQFEEKEHRISYNSEYQFELNLELPEPTIGHLYYGNEKVDLYIEPGDNLSISFDPQHFQKTLFYRGRGAEANNYLKNRKVLFERLEIDLPKQIKDSKAKGFVAFMENIWKEKRKYLRDYNQAHSFTKSFLAYAEADIDYWHGYNMLNYPWEHPLHHNQEGPMELDASYYQFLNEVSIVSEDGLPNMYYTYFLDQFFSYQKDQPENESLTDFQLAEKYLQGMPLYYYKAKLYSISCKRGKAKEVGPAIKNFIEECTSNTYNDVLRMVYNEAKGLLKGELAPEFTLADVNGNEVALSDLRGKIVYLDFWATWCPPCVHSLRNSKQWKSKFKDKDVAFVYVSLDKETHSWKNFIRRQGIDGVHVIADSPNVYKSQIAKLYKVKRLPAVFLIDKAGKIFYNSSAKDARQVPVADMINDLLLSN